VRIAFLLPGIHSVDRGAEVAFQSVASAIAEAGADEVTVFGSGPDRPDRRYSYRRVPLIRRQRFEHFPTIPPFRSNYVYEEATWTVAALRWYRSSDYDVTVSCSFPFVNWLATRWPPARTRPAHVFVTQNGDHPALAKDREYRSFRCDGLVCTNPVYFERQRDVWRSELIPNGIDPVCFSPGPPERSRFGLPEDAPVVLIVGALIESKRVLEGLAAVAAIPGAHLVVAGDGPLRDQFDATGAQLMPGRYRRLVVPSDTMPALYRSADVVLHPSLFESFGNVYIEAMAIGLPVVAHDSVVTRWILRDDPGLVDTTDPAQMTGAVTAALARDRGESLRRVGEVHERFAWSTIAQQYREFFRDLVGP
jgi:glycosyltransferase involved in cell wall biosynthesis